jgi:hypothetical protein
VTVFQRNNIPFSSLSWRRWPLKPLASFPSRKVYGFDTETLDGYCRLITCSDGRVYQGHDIEEILTFLTYKGCRSAHNFFYNISYDMDSIFKYMPVETLKEILLTGKAEYVGYHIKAIPGKVYTFTKAKHRYSYYDLWQFYESSLETAAKKYLGEDKYILPIDRHQIGTSAAYWQLHGEDIETYCMNDSRLTERLGEALQREVSNTFSFTPKHYVSKAGLSKQYFRHRCQIPDVKRIPRGALEYAFNAYHGGRFEVTERGNIGFATAIDINSAYPYQIANLLDITRGEWRHCRRMNPEATYGFYACRITHHYSHLPLCALKLSGQTFYPWGEWHGFLTKEEIEEVEKRGEVRIYAGWEFFPDEEVYPFREAIYHLYNAKSRAEKGSYQYSLYKIVMNSLYGAFYEKVLMPDGTFRVGSLFNPIYATLITARTRVALTKEAWKYGRKAVCLATDGILIRGDIAPESSSDLGAFSVKEQGESVILRSGIYTIGKECKQRGVIKSHSIKTPYGDFSSIFDYLTAFPDMSSYPVILHRPIHLREAVTHSKKYTVEDVNKFMNMTLTFDLNTERKRVFAKRDLTGRDLLETSIESVPWKAETLLSHLTPRGRGKG